MSDNEYTRLYMKSYRQRDKAKIFDHYGRICVCCGETTPEFLTIDHKDNDGYEHRKSINSGRTKGGNKELYRWIINNDFPDSIQILCWNCNCGRAQTEDKICPHQKALSNHNIT